jgi:predicted permease
MAVMSGFLQDFRYALRQLSKSPGFTAIAVITLALGIGANSAIFSVIEAVMLRALPYHDSARLILLADADDHDNGGFLYEDFAPFQAQARSFEDLAIYYRDSGYSRAVLNTGGEPEQVQGAWVSANLFPLMGVLPQLGRTFTGEEQAREERIVVLSHGLWEQRFGGARDIVGKSLSINGAAFRIIGVMPETFQFPARDQMFWAPITTNSYWNDPALGRNLDASRAATNYSRFFFERWQVIGRLRRGVTPAQAQAESEMLLQRRAQSEPDKFRMAALHLMPLRTQLSGNTRLALTLLFVAVCCVLLIACTNVASLMLARGARREREMVIRAALGARRGRLVRQLLTEGFVLSLIAATLGLALAYASVRVLVASAPADIPRLEQAGISMPLLAFTFLLSLLTTVLFGVGPAIHFSRRSAQAALSTNTRGASASRALRRAHNVLVVTEFAVALVLLTGAGLLLRSFLAVEAVDPGFEPRHVLILRMTVPDATPARLLALHQEVLERLRTLPGVEAAGAINDLFELGPPNLLGLRAIEGRQIDSKDQSAPLSWKTVSADYFQAIGVTLLKGRYFTDQDAAGSPLVAIIDESMAGRYWPNQDPIGAHIKGQDARGQSDEWLTIIGVVGNMRRSGLEYAPTPHVFEWYRQAGANRTEDLLVRGGGDVGALSASLRSTVRAEAATAVLSRVSTVEDLLSDQLAPRRFQTWLFGLFSALALLLATIGIYGVMHYSVTQRAHEIGVRMALGARPSEILSLVEGEGLRLAVGGVVLGGIGALWLTPLISRLLFGVSPTDPLTFLAVVSTLVAAALVACYIPARRAAQVNPIVALRYE